MKKPSVPPVYNPFAGQAILPKMPPIVRPAAPGARAVIQRAREKTEQNMNYLLVPTPDLYTQHVTQRITHFVTVLLEVWHVVLHAKANATGSPQKMGNSVSAIAEAQVGGGIYTGSFAKTDAAHLMNTTVRSDNLLKGWSPSSTQEQMIQALHTASAATTPQRKADNVGPDKVIDSCMTVLAQSWAARCDKGEAVPSAASLIAEVKAKCLASLKSNRKSINANYQQALAGINAVDERSTSDVSNEYELWIKAFSS